MPNSLVPEEQQTKLKKAAALMSEVQQELPIRSDRGSDDYIQSWKDLYWLRERLARREAT
jgi:hypothetical protein